MELRILIVTPDEKKGNFFKVLFKDMGHQVSSAENAVFALKIFANYLKYENAFDLVFIDYLLPGTNGITLACQLHKIYPGVNLVLFPTELMQTPAVKEDYCRCRAFIQQEPDAGLPAYQDVISRTQRKKEILLYSLV